MNTTIFLAQVWGPMLVAIGLGFFLSASYYVRVYRDLEKDAFAVLFFGMFAMAAGIAQILAHNAWGSFPEGLISFLGWATLVKGIVCVAFPRLADRGGDWALHAKVVPAAGGVTLLIGGYLSWIGYFL